MTTGHSAEIWEFLTEGDYALSSYALTYEALKNTPGVQHKIGIFQAPALETLMVTACEMKKRGCQGHTAPETSAAIRTLASRIARVRAPSLKNMSSRNSWNSLR